MGLGSIAQRPAFIAVTRIAGAGLGFATQAALARLLGAHGLGLFYSATSLAIAAGYVTTLGYSQLVARFAARYRAPARAPLFARFMARAGRDTMIAAILACGIIVALAATLPRLGADERWTYAAAGFTVLASSSLTLFTNAAAAIRSFGWCYLPEGLFRPALFLLLVLAGWLGGVALTAVAVTVAFGALTTLIAVAQYAATRRQLPPRAPLTAAGRRLDRRWRREARPLILLSLYTNAFADIGILTATPFLPPAAIAVFGLCLKLSLLVGYVVQVTQQMVVPDLADARLRHDPAGLRDAVRRATLLPIGLTVAATAVCAVAGDRILGIFGPHFAVGHGVLVALIASQVLRAVAGPSSQLLSLAGAQRTTASLCLASLAAYLVGIAVLAKPFGALGIALAVLLSYGVWIAGTALVLNRRGEARADALSLLGGTRLSPGVPRATAAHR